MVGGVLIPRAAESVLRRNVRRPGVSLSRKPDAGPEGSSAGGVGGRDSPHGVASGRRHVESRVEPRTSVDGRGSADRQLQDLHRDHIFDAHAKRTMRRYKGATLDAGLSKQDLMLSVWQTSEGLGAMQLQGTRVIILEGLPEKANVAKFLKVLALSTGH